MKFIDLYNSRKEETGSRLIVGLDPVLERLPEEFRQVDLISVFFERIILMTHDAVLGYKPNIAFFGQYGPSGLEQLEIICRKIIDIGAILILDAKRGDIGSTNRALAKEIFEYYGAHATTLNPLLGFGALKEFFVYENNYMFILNFTSNPDSEQFFLFGGERPLYREISEQISLHPNCGAVAGATKLEYLQDISEGIKDSLMLVPGIGAQGGDLEDSVRAIGDDKFLLNASRSVIYASPGPDFAERSRDKVEEINRAVIKTIEEVL